MQTRNAGLPRTDAFSGELRYRGFVWRAHAWERRPPGRPPMLRIELRGALDTGSGGGGGGEGAPPPAASAGFCGDVTAARSAGAGGAATGATGRPPLRGRLEVASSGMTLGSWAVADAWHPFVAGAFLTQQQQMALNADSADDAEGRVRLLLRLVED